MFYLWDDQITIIGYQIEVDCGVVFLCGSGQEAQWIELAHKPIVMFNGTVACRWNEKETSYKYKVAEGEDGTLKVIGLSLLVCVSQQEDGHDDSHHIPVREDKPR